MRDQVLAATFVLTVFHTALAVSEEGTSEKLVPSATSELGCLGPSTEIEKVRFESLVSAARFAVTRCNPESIRTNTEVGGFLLRFETGGFGIGKTVRGDHGRLSFPAPRSVVPDDAILAATWHTHGATMPGIISETFSPQDIAMNKQFSVDGFLATPEGKFLRYYLNNPNIELIGLLGEEF